MLIDSHCHLNYLDEPDARLDEARAGGVDGFLCISVDEHSHPDVLAIANRHDDVWASAGVHPDAATNAPDLTWLDALIESPRITAIGETGLDFLHLEPADDAGRQAQLQAFDAQLSIARAADLPVVVHTRAATRETRDMLAAHAGVRGVLHCFTESWELARAALDQGFYVSISGIVTFKNATNVRDVASQLPLDRLLIETDAPWLAPVPHRGVPNHPALLPHTAKFLAQLKGLDYEALAAATTHNFFALFNQARR